MRQVGPTHDYHRREIRLGWILISPCLLFLAVFAIFPVIQTLVMAFQSHAELSLGSGYTLDNFATTLKDQYFWESLWVTVVFVVVTVFFQTLFGLVLAVLANKTFKGQGLARASLLLPWAMPPVIAAMAWRWMANDSYGVFNDLLCRFGLTDGKTVWLGDPQLASFALMALAVWKVSSFMGLLILAGLQSIPDDLYEAASIDGAGKLKGFLDITLPLLKPTILVAVLLRTLQALQVFDLPYALTGGGPGNATETLGIFIYRSSFVKLEWATASAQAVLLMIISILITIVYFRMSRRERA